MGNDRILIDHPVILFDGVCNLCNSSVQSIIRLDKKGKFRFASLQSSVAKELLKPYLTELENIDSIVLISGQASYIKSDAALEIIRSLGGLMSVLSILRFLPRSLRDACYDWIARNRYRWFGKRDECMVPTPEVESRFLL